jgi:hypothetical protein
VAGAREGWGSSHSPVRNDARDEASGLVKPRAEPRKVAAMPLVIPPVSDVVGRPGDILALTPNVLSVRHCVCQPKRRRSSLLAALPTTWSWSETRTGTRRSLSGEGRKDRLLARRSKRPVVTHFKKAHFRNTNAPPPRRPCTPRGSCPPDDG